MSDRRFNRYNCWQDDVGCRFIILDSNAIGWEHADILHEDGSCDCLNHNSEQFHEHVKQAVNFEQALEWLMRKEN